jgi:spore coat polysaccharide biosynthesis protein SpsF
MKVGYLITARLKSTRLPRKLLREVKGRPILTHMIDRLKLAKRVDEIVICTSSEQDDLPLVSLAEQEGVRWFCGDPDDVLERLSNAAATFDLDYVLNITADCPFVDPAYADRIVQAYEETKADLIRALDLPHGIYSYGVRPTALRMVQDIKNSKETEVWGRYFTDIDLFQVYDLPIDPPHRQPGLRMTLDYPQDLAFFEAVFDHLYQPGKVFSLDDILILLKDHPEIVAINQHCAKLYKRRWTAQSEISLKPRYHVHSAAIVGCGSIGQRHIRNLRALGIAEITALRTHHGYTQSLDPALNVHEVSDWDSLLDTKPDIAIISNPTSLHVASARRLLPHVRGLFVEKPLGVGIDDELRALLAEASTLRRTTMVGYNLRYHPVVVAMMQELADGKLGEPICLQCQVGQWLPDWHPYEDYRQGYYSRRELGGGVTLTLSHEIDLALALLGPAQHVQGLTANVEGLEISVDAVANLTVRHCSGAVSQIHLDYAQRMPSRSGTLICNHGWMRYDLIAPSLVIHTSDQPQSKRMEYDEFYDPNTSYREMMQSFLRYTCEGRVKHALDLRQGAAVLNVAIQALSSAERGVWLAISD